MTLFAFIALSFLVNLIVNAVLWAVSLVRRNVTVIDPFWGLGFAIMTGVLCLVGPGAPGRTALVVVLAWTWGLRYALHLYWREWGHSEATTYYPYREWRAQAGARFWWVSWFRIFLPQALGTTVIGLPILAVMHGAPAGPLGRAEAVGVIVWLAGFACEAVADLQLARFKHDPANRGQVMDRGLWRYSRHPNYFGDALVWWGFFVVALGTPGSGWTIVSPALMTYLLTRVSGVAMVERRSASARSPAYAAYVETTSAFVPWFPRRLRG